MKPFCSNCLFTSNEWFVNLVFLTNCFSRLFQVSKFYYLFWSFKNCTKFGSIGCGNIMLLRKVQKLEITILLRTPVFFRRNIWMAWARAVSFDPQHGVGDGAIGRRRHVPQILRLHVTRTESQHQHPHVDRHSLCLRPSRFVAQKASRA